MQMHGIQFSSGHQGRTQSDPHWPQVSVPLISRPVVSYREGGTTPLRGVQLHLYEVLIFVFLECDHVASA